MNMGFPFYLPMTSTCCSASAMFSPQWIPRCLVVIELCPHTDVLTVLPQIEVFGGVSPLGLPGDDVKVCASLGDSPYHISVFEGPPWLLLWALPLAKLPSPSSLTTADKVASVNLACTWLIHTVALPVPSMFLTQPLPLHSLVKFYPSLSSRSNITPRPRRHPYSAPPPFRQFVISMSIFCALLALLEHLSFC